MPKKTPKRSTPTRRPVEDAIRSAIINSGQSAKQIAAESGVPQPTISRFIKHERTLQLPNVDLLADYFGLELVPRLRSHP